MINILKGLGLVAFSLVGAATTFVVGGPPQATLYRRFGLATFIALNLLAIIALLALAAKPIAGVYAVLSALVGLYFFAFTKTRSLFWSGMISILLTVGLSGVLLATISKGVNKTPSEAVKVWVQSEVDVAIKLAPDLKIDKEEIFNQVVSLYVISLIAALWIALAFEEGIGRGLVRMKPSSDTKAELTTFKVPDEAVWIAIASFSLTYLKLGVSEPVRVVALNVFNVLVFLYFLQGLAVVSRGFKVYKVRQFWRVVTYVLMFIQLVPVSLFGLLDLWFDFRSKFQRKTPNVIN